MTLTARRTTWAQAHIVTSWPVPSPTTVRARIGMIRLAAERRHQQCVDWNFDWKGAMGMCVNARAIGCRAVGGGSRNRL